jgi:signal transduction histidine kinase
MNKIDPKVAEWLNTVAHDLKTPINSVRGCVQIIPQLGPLTERQEHFVERAMAGLDRMEHLVSRLLDISWVDSDVQLELTDVDLSRLIHDAVDPLQMTAAQRQIQIDLDLDPQLNTFRGDARRMGQVFDNLVSNAIKYNREGGRVLVRAAYEGDAVLVSVSDTGIGIATEEQQRVFDRFFRSRQSVALKIEGSGLGLAITRSIVQKHGGHIWVESSAGEGTTFSFMLPLAVAHRDGDDGSGEANQEAGEGNERWDTRRAELASEERDVVDDDMQETREYTQVDTSSDDV